MLPITARPNILQPLPRIIISHLTANQILPIEELETTPRLPKLRVRSLDSPERGSDSLSLVLLRCRTGSLDRRSTRRLGSPSTSRRRWRSESRLGGTTEVVELLKTARSGGSFGSSFTLHATTSTVSPCTRVGRREVSAGSSGGEGGGDVGTSDEVAYSLQSSSSVRILEEGMEDVR
jgi:hypothetical protein